MFPMIFWQNCRITPPIVVRVKTPFNYQPKNHQLPTDTPPTSNYQLPSDPKPMKIEGFMPSLKMKVNKFAGYHVFFFWGGRNVNVGPPTTVGPQNRLPCLRAGKEGWRIRGATSRDLMGVEMIMCVINIPRASRI